MGTSSREGKEKIKSWVNTLGNINTVLDIGTGKGTYVQLLKHKGKIIPRAKFIGVEAWLPYIERFNLRIKYDEIINEDIRNLNFSSIGRVDLTIAGDVLEHITKEEAIRVVKEISKISQFMIISIPIVHYPQDEINNNPFEKHIKDDWSDNEILEIWSPLIIDKEIGNEIGVYLLKF